MQEFLSITADVFIIIISFIFLSEKIDEIFFRKRKRSFEILKDDVNEMRYDLYNFINNPKKKK